MLWKDGQPTYFTEEVGTELTGLAVAGSDIYVAGNAYDFDYTTFEEIYRSPVWKNGTEMALEVVISDNFTVWGLACAFVDTQE